MTDGLMTITDFSKKNYTTLHHTTLHYTTLHYILHYILNYVLQTTLHIINYTAYYSPTTSAYCTLVAYYVQQHPHLVPFATPGLSTAQKKTDAQKKSQEAMRA